MKKINSSIIIGGNEIIAGIDLNDAKETGMLKRCLVIQFDSDEDMQTALNTGVVNIEWGKG
jgi:hypothetical protein